MTSSIQNTQQPYYTGSNSTTTGGTNNNAQLASALESAFTTLASAINSNSNNNTGLSGNNEPGGNTAVIQGIAQALDTIVTAITGQNPNLEASLNAATGSSNSNSNTNTNNSNYNTNSNTNANTTGSNANTNTNNSNYNANSATSTYSTSNSTNSTYNTNSNTGTSYNTNTNTQSTTSSASVGGAGNVSAISGSSAGFTENQLHQYIVTALSQNSDASQNGLSGPQNLAYWDPTTTQGKANLDSFYNGIVAAHDQFFPGTSINTFAQALVAEAGAESTLNPTAGGGGLLQVTQADAVNDYNNHGTPIKDASGNTVLSPGQTWDQNNPEANVLMWAWYNKNNLAAGGVAPNNWGKGQNNGIANTYGNVLADWLGGPGDKLGDGTDYYVNRIQQFFQKIGGSSSDFQNLLNTQLTSDQVGVK